jgi:hypothetical protein
VKDVTLQVAFDTSSSDAYGPPPPPAVSEVASGVDSLANGHIAATPSTQALPSAFVNASANAKVVTAPSVQSSTTTSVSVSGSAAKSYPIAEVKVRDVLVLRLKLADGGLLPQERAKRAKRAIEAALVESKIETVRTELHGNRALLFVGSRPIVELNSADAEVMGEGSLELYTASAAAKVRDLLESERRQSVVANTVLNIVLAGALAVCVVFALRLLGGLSRKVQRFIELNPERIPALHLRSIEVVRPHVLRSGLVVGVGVLKLVLQFALIYTWLVFASSLFDATKGLADRLTSLVLSPLAALMTRLAALLPLVLVTAIALAAMVVLLRFVKLFFAAVQRRETELSWLRPELAAPTSLLIRIGLIASSLLFLAPVVTGNMDGALSRLGLLFAVTVALASTPLLANVVVGLVTLYGARLSEGDLVQFGGEGRPELRGRVQAIGLIEMTLRTEAGQEVRVAHLAALCRPLIVSGQGPKAHTEGLIVEAEAKPERLVEILGQLVTERKLSATVQLLRLSGTVSCAELRIEGVGFMSKQAVLIEVGRLLAEAGLPLVLAQWRDVT